MPKHDKKKRLKKSKSAAFDLSTSAVAAAPVTSLPNAPATRPYQQLEPDTNPQLVEAVFGIPVTLPNDDKAAREIMDKKSNFWVVQEKYHFYQNGNISMPVNFDSALQSLKQCAELFLKSFKYLYLLKLSDLQFEAIKQAFKPAKKIPIPFVRYEQVNNDVVQTVSDTDDTSTQADIYYPATAVAIIIDGMSDVSVLSLLEVLPPTVNKIGLDRVSAKIAMAVEKHVAKNKLGIEIYFSDRLKEDIKDMAWTDFTSSDSFDENLSVDRRTNGPITGLKRSQSDYFEHHSEPPTNKQRSNIEPAELPTMQRVHSDPVISFSPNLSSSSSSYRSPYSNASLLSAYGTFANLGSPGLNSIPSFDLNDGNSTLHN